MPGVDILATAFNGANAAFIADLYAKWIENPGAVDPSFADLFSALNDESRAVLTDASGASWAPRLRAFTETAPAGTDPTHDTRYQLVEPGMPLPSLHPGSVQV